MSRHRIDCGDEGYLDVQMDGDEAPDETLTEALREVARAAFAKMDELGVDGEKQQAAIQRVRRRAEGSS